MAGVVIVGAGECGVRAAFTLRESGQAGAIRLIDAEPHTPYERPPLSKTLPPAAKPIMDAARYREANIDFTPSLRVAAIDTAAKAVRLADGSVVPYDKLLIATGARPRLFPGMDGALTLRTVDDAHAILGRIGPGFRLAIVGGGFIGLELAATARKLGASVTLVEAAPRLMGRAVPAEIAAIAEARHRAEGVDVRLGVPVAGTTANAILLKDGGRIEADLVVAGVGSSPNVELAKEAGIAVDNGIVVDHAFRTSAPDVFAAGDCCAFPYRGQRVRLESWRAAQEQGAHAARAMLGAEDAYAAVPWFWSDQYDLTLQVAGLADPALPPVRRDLGDGAFILFQLDADGALIAASGIGTGNAVARDVRLAEMLIAKGAKPDPEKLADAGAPLKAMLRG